MNEMFFVCDESGAKGFADKPEQAPREIGLLAGVIVPRSEETVIRTKMAAIAAKCPASADGKLHITGLGKADSEALRKEVFEMIKEHKLTCVFSATASQGYHESFRKLKEAEAAAAKPSHLVDLNPKLQPERLHADLFQEAFGTAIAWCEKRFGEKAEATVHVRTDQVEDKIINEFRSTAAALTAAPLDQTQNLKFYDKPAKKPVTATIKTEFKGAEMYGPATHIKYTIEIDNTAFTLLADVVANSLYDHIKKRFEAGQILDLNGPAAVEGHDLAAFIDGLNSVDGVPVLSDIVHRHPDVRKPVEQVRVEVEEIKGDSLDV